MNMGRDRDLDDPVSVSVSGNMCGNLIRKFIDKGPFHERLTSDAPPPLKFSLN